MQRILLGLAVIVAVGGGVAASTGAFFNDTETSTGNTFAAGSIDLKVDSQSHYDGLMCSPAPTGGGYTWQLETQQGTTSRPDLLGQSCDGSWTLTDLGPTNKFFDLSDLKPGDSGEDTLSLHVLNNDAYACAVVSNMHDNDLSLTNPEYKAGDPSSGPDLGEMASQLHFFAWDDNGGSAGTSSPEAGNNKWDPGEQALFSNVSGPASDVLAGKSYPLYTPQTQSMPAGNTDHIGLYWCYGTLTVDSGNHTLSCNGSSVNNLSQTDQLSADLSFYVEQARNNPGFTCPEPASTTPQTFAINQDGLDQNATGTTTSPALIANDGLGKWFFYNDSDDTVSNSLGTIAAGPGSPTPGPGSAQMTLSAAFNRIALATYQFAGIPLADITELKYGAYSSAGTGAPALEFNVDFNDPSFAPADSWQHRLLYLPGEGNTPPAAGTWTDIDALNGNWSWSGLTGHGGSSATWPDGTPAGTYLTWSQIKSKWPNARIRVTDPWLGFRMGSPGPSGLTGAVSYFKFQTTGNPETTFNFTN